MVFADAEEVHAERVGQHRFLDHVADHLRVRQQNSVRAGGDIAERVQSEFERLRHGTPRYAQPVSGPVLIGNHS